MAPPNTSYANLASAPIVDVDRVPIAQVRQARKHIRILACVEPHEVLMITLDEEGRPSCRSVLGEPSRKIARAVVMARCFIEPIRVGPNPKVAHVQDVVEANAKHRLEREHALIQTVHRSMNVAGRADQHGAPSSARIRSRSTASDLRQPDVYKNQA